MFVNFETKLAFDANHPTVTSVNNKALKREKTTEEPNNARTHFSKNRGLRTHHTTLTFNFPA
jgi:hypothetical protein